MHKKDGNNINGEAKKVFSKFIINVVGMEYFQASLFGQRFATFTWNFCPFFAISEPHCYHRKEEEEEGAGGGGGGGGGGRRRLRFTHTSVCRA